MSFNQVENAFLSQAIKGLVDQMKGIKKYSHLFADGRTPYLGHGVTFMLTDDERLAVGIESRPGSGKYRPDPDIEPVDCYNLIREDECMADAVSRVFG